MTGSGEESPKKRARTEDLESFTQKFDGLIEEILEATKTLTASSPVESEQLSAHIKQLLLHAGPGGKMTRGLTVVSVFKTLCPSASEQQVTQAQMLGWAIEMLQAFFLVADDVMDQSLTRRGKPCWYKMPDIGLKAINDSLFLESIVYFLVKKHLSKEACYCQILELFHEVTMRTVLGQSLDLATESTCGGGAKELNLEEFTLERVRAIAEHKTSYYSFYLPIALGMSLAGRADEASLEETKKICVDMGVYFQAQDDYLDCYGDPATIGKVGTDIESAKCSWLMATALQRMSPQQKLLIKENYGHYDAAKVAIVKGVFKELAVEEAFRAYEEESYQQLKQDISELKCAPQSVFSALLARVYKRST